MRYRLSDVGDSWTATLVFAVGVAFVVFAVVMSGGSESFGAPVGSMRWWLGIGGAGVAILLTVGNRLR